MLHSCVCAFIILCLPALSLLSSEVTVSPIPNWVVPHDVSLEEMPLHPSQCEFQSLLFDIQTHVEENVQYHHSAYKITGPVGLKMLSSIKIGFDPSFDSIVMHKIRVYREGQWSDRLAASRYKIIQKEEDLEKSIYSGQQTLIYFLDNIRMDDIIDYEFSYKSSKTIFINSIELQPKYLTKNIYNRILVSPERHLTFRSFNTPTEPVISTYSPNLDEYAWETVGGESCKQDLFSWNCPCSWVQVSSEQSWNEVANQGLIDFQLPDDFISNPSVEMLNLVHEWKITTSDNREQARLALRFVQNELRYMAFHDNDGGHVPHDPREVLARRYGDCKDKSFLLHALLSLMDIHSTVVLVNIKARDSMKEFLPSARIFDHVIVKIEIDDSIYWVDPTIEFEYGPLDEIDISAYYWALPLDSQTYELERIPEAVVKKPIEIETLIDFIEPNIIQLIKETTYYGRQADFQRILYNDFGIQWCADMRLSSMKKGTPNISVIEPVSFIDDIESNTLTISEWYEIPLTCDYEKSCTTQVPSFILFGYLQSILNDLESDRYELSYPLWVREHVRIPHLVDGNFKNKQLTFSHEVFEFSVRIENGYDVYYELKHLKDHIPADTIQELKDTIKAIRKEAHLSVTQTITVESEHPLAYFLKLVWSYLLG